MRADCVPGDKDPPVLRPAGRWGGCSDRRRLARSSWLAAGSGRSSAGSRSSRRWRACLVVRVQHSPVLSEVTGDAELVTHHLSGRLLQQLASGVSSSNTGSGRGRSCFRGLRRRPGDSSSTKRWLQNSREISMLRVSVKEEGEAFVS